MAETKHYRVGQKYIGGFSFPGTRRHPDVPAEAVRCPAPASGKALWIDGAWDNSAQYRDLRRHMYFNAGITDNRRTEALWDLLMEGDSTKADALKIERDAARADPDFLAKPSA